MQERKIDTRQKILLGGLIVKAGLRDIDSNIILGMLIDGATKLQSKDADYVSQYFKDIGDEAFEDDKNNNT